jgi:Lhr-like helicase
MGYEKPTPVQRDTIPAFLEGHDLVVQSRTGTGKTAAFGIPIVERVDIARGEIQALVLTPTRELTSGGERYGSGPGRWVSHLRRRLDADQVRESGRGTSPWNAGRARPETRRLADGRAVPCSTRPTDAR